MDPLFHPDIEREIFEFSAYADSKTMPFTLILVAKHVQQWIEPLIYRHIDLYHKTSEVIPDILAIGEARGGDFLANAVRSISFENLDHNKTPAEMLTKLIDACPRVNYLGLCGNPFYPGSEQPELQESIAKLEELTHIGLPFSDCYFSLITSRGKLDKTTPWCLTHVDLGTHRFPPLKLLDIETLPYLTHVAFGPFPFGYGVLMLPTIPNILEFIEARGHQLRCFWLTGIEWNETELMKLQHENAYRHFLVVQLTAPSDDECMANWNAMVGGTGSLWGPALKVLERRAQGLNDEQESTKSGARLTVVDNYPSLLMVDSDHEDSNSDFDSESEFEISEEEA
ncbi:hypothetical protein DL96DRAFT_1595661 [Flagelloscypha sp. PMI_526]|nr:hypothetical protein DL96DRAFT_1595661 [Flagelloscypha sp. PMI_526]